MRLLHSKSRLPSFTALVLLFLCLPLARVEGKENSRDPAAAGVPILLYHRFGPVIADSMTVTTPVFESHLRYLRDHAYTVIPLKQLVGHCLGGQPPLPSRPVVIVVDDGHRTVYTDMVPLLKRYQLPMTLFVYPSAISNASYAMTWQQLREVGTTGLIDFQSHTFWHPNFKKEKERLNPVDYEKLLEMQLKKSKAKLDVELGTHVDMLAWPFGIYDGVLTKKASEAGYVAGFSIERRHVIPTDNVMALPRYLMSDGDREKAFGRILAGPPHG
jgi:peptidoglycan/xylan/chitin deacetylase (PgdA/CDA1 family)